MRRQDRYPDTDTFEFGNANPKNRITGDCVARAISTATGKPWEDVVMELADLSCETGYAAACKETYGRYLEKNGFTRMKQPRKSNGKKYTGKEFCKRIAPQYNQIVAKIGGHHITAVVDRDGKKKIHDIWDCSYKTIGIWWCK